LRCPTAARLARLSSSGSRSTIAQPPPRVPSHRAYSQSLSPTRHREVARALRGGIHERDCAIT
jgi:hypothetical protein